MKKACDERGAGILPAMPLRLAYAFLIMAVVGSGCGPRKASVTGTVKFKGEPLPSGTVLLHGADGRVEHALITKEGKYTVTDAPQGAVRISVRSHAEAPRGFPARGKPPSVAGDNLPPNDGETRDGKYVVIPTRYLDPDKSGLTFDVKGGSQRYDIELVP